MHTLSIAQLLPDVTAIDSKINPETIPRAIPAACDKLFASSSFLLYVLLLAILRVKVIIKYRACGDTIFIYTEKMKKDIILTFAVFDRSHSCILLKISTEERWIWKI